MHAQNEQGDALMSPVRTRRLSSVQLRHAISAGRIQAGDGLTAAFSAAWMN
jgi:hypothetical protein